MSQPDHSAHIFISYSRADSAAVDRLIADLHTSGVKTWFDRQNLKSPTSNWDQAIRDAIQTAAAFFLMASPASRRSEPVQGEVDFAASRDVQIYPIWIDGADDRWIDCVRLDRSQHQHIDVRGDNYIYGFDLILEALDNLGILKSKPININLQDETPPKTEQKSLSAKPSSVQADIKSLKDQRTSTHSQLIQNLIDTGHYDAAKSLVASPTWLKTCRALENSLDDGYIVDLDTVWNIAHESILEQIQTGQMPGKLADSTQFALIRTSLNTTPISYPPEFIERAIELGIWSTDYAVSVVAKISEYTHRLTMLASILKSDRLTTDQRRWAEQGAVKILKAYIKEQYVSGTVALRIEALAPVIQLEESIQELSELIPQMAFISERSQALAALAPRLSDGEKSRLIDTQLSIIEKTGDGLDRMQSIAHLAPLMTADRADLALTIILSHRKTSDFDWALERLAVALDGDSLPRALEATFEVSKEEHRATILSNLAPKLSGDTLKIAVEAAYALSSPSARMEALASLSTRLDGDKKTAALDAALAAAESIENPYMRALSLLWKAFNQFPSDYQIKALHLSYQAANLLPMMGRPDLRCEILGRIIFHLCKQRLDDDLLEEALRNLGHSPYEHGRAADLLSTLLPHLPEGQQNYRDNGLKVLSDLVGLLYDKDETKPENTVRWISALFPYVSSELGEEIVADAVSVIQGITNADAREKALKSLIPKLTVEHLRNIEKLILEPADHSAHSAALGRLARHLTGEFRETMLQKAFELGTSSRLSERQRAVSIAHLAPYLYGPLLIKAIDTAVGWEDELNQSGALAAIAEAAVDVPIAKLFEMALGFDESVAKSQLLTSLAPSLNKKQVDRCLNAALQLEHPQQKIKILSRLRERLSGKQITRILKHFREAYDPLTYVEAVGLVLPRITQAKQHEDMLSSAVEIILAAHQKYEDAWRIVQAATAIAKFLPDDIRYRVLDHALEAALLMENNMQAFPSGSVPQATALEKLAPYLTGIQMKRAFNAARKITDFKIFGSTSMEPKFRVLIALAPQMAYEQLSATLNAAFKSDDAWETVHVLEAIAPHLTSDLIDKADAAITNLEGPWQRARAWLALRRVPNAFVPKIQQAIAEHLRESATEPHEKLLWSFDVQLYTPEFIGQSAVNAVAKTLMEFSVSEVTQPL